MHDFVNLFNYFCAFILDVLKHILDFYFVYHHFKFLAFENYCDCDVLDSEIVRLQYFLVFFKDYSENY